ncbi:hypothetical protein SD71_08965 [Cohnella kolymensis]|uniref:Abasic site processing protein n=1 Tax=Cohnella kolymensis TaxID=1590652 RepID=A0ABR5A6Q2_9BACL|nr:SOS response-associated peptidase [Cohnella kolymensis]KIL36235.1 hypothetical protein SD71_08965 [Cohnella kolymensis]
MCDRFSLTADLDRLTQDFGIEHVHIPYQRRYNIAPTQEIPVIQQIGEERCLNQQRWGLMPYWGKCSVNTDRGSVADKPYLRSMLAKRRCVVPCSGFYIWQGDGRTKRAWHAVHPKKPVFAMAGMFDNWIDSERKEYPMCTVITAESANGLNRSAPLLLDEASVEVWLDGDVTDTEVLREMLHSLPLTEFYVYPVSPRVEDISMQDPECVAEVAVTFSRMKS